MMDLPASLTGDPERDAMIERLEQLLFDPLEADEEEPPLKLYALLDASKSPDIPIYLEAFNSPATCLFDGQTRDDLAEVAPWLVQFDRYSDAWDWFAEEGWGNGWGILMHSRQPIARLKTHFKKFLKITRDDGEPNFFKFYVPIHLRKYLPLFEEKELMRIYQRIDAFFVEDAGQVSEFRLDEGEELSQKYYRLNQEPDLLTDP